MEVIVQDIKQELEGSGSSKQGSSQTQRILISPSHHHHSGGTTTKFSNNNSHQNNNNHNISILQNSLTSNTNNNFTTTSSISNSSVRNKVTTTKLNGHQQTMAKSSGLSIVHVSLPQTVIQTPSVIQSASGHLQLSKGNVILVQSKPNSSVIHQTTGGALQTVQLLQEAHHSDESLSNDGDHPSSQDRRRRDILTRRPSYRKILNDLGASEIADKGDSSATSESSQDPLDNSSGSIVIGGNQYPQSVVKVINTNALGLGLNTAADGTNSATALQTITMTNAGTAGGTIVQYAQSHDGQQFFVPVGGELQAYTIRPVSSSASSSPSVVVSGGSGHHPPEEQTRKREIRLLKNREAARECRRKKKEYIKCLENRVAVLENQNKALIDELKSLKELYCQQKTE